MWAERWWPLRWWPTRYWAHWGCTPDGDNDVHVLSRWVIVTAALMDWEDPVYDSGWGVHDLDEHVVPDGTLTPGVGYCERLGVYTEGCCVLWSEPYCWIQPGVDVPCIITPPAKRVEVWSDLECRGGTLEWVLSRYGEGPGDNPVVKVGMREEVMGRAELMVDIPRNSPVWDHLDDRKVLRIVFIDGTWREWRLINDTDERTPDNATTSRLACQDPRYDLGERVVVNRQANGLNMLGWSVFNQPVAAHLETILGLAEEAGLDHLEAGTVEADPTDRYDLDYSNASPLGLLNKLADMANLELLVWPNEDESYAVHMVEQIGAECDTPHLRYRKNNLRLKRQVRTENLATRVYPTGQTLDGVPLTIANAQWPISQVDSANRRVYLRNAPLLYDDQMVDFYAELVGSGGVRFRVTGGNEAEQYITLRSVEGFAAGDSVVFREDEAGSELVYLQNPTTAGHGPDAVRGAGTGDGTHGVVAPPQAPSELPHIDNLAPNGFLSVWEGDDDGLLPQDWEAVGGATVARTTDQLYFQHGSGSMEVEADSGDGVRSGWVPIAPTERRRYFSLQTSLWVLEGQVRLELVVDTGTEELVYPDPSGSDVAHTEGQDRWDHELGIGGIDLYEVGGKFARVRVVAHGGAAHWYVDAVVLTQTPGGVDGRGEGLASVQLWHEALHTLALYSTPEVIYEVEVADLTRLDGTRYPFDTLGLGAHAVLWDEGLEVQDTVRMVALERPDLFVGLGDTRVTLSRTPDALTAFLNRERTGSRRAVSRVGSGPGEPGDPGDPSGGTGEGSISTLAVQLLRDDTTGTYLHFLQWYYNPVIANASAGEYTIDIVEDRYDMDNEGLAIGSVSIVDDYDPTEQADLPSQFTQPVVLDNEGNLTTSVPWDINGTEVMYQYHLRLWHDGSVIQRLSATVTDTYEVE